MDIIEVRGKRYNWRFRKASSYLYFLSREHHKIGIREPIPHDREMRAMFFDDLQTKEAEKYADRYGGTGIMPEFVSEMRFNKFIELCQNYDPDIIF